jgi:hypothetical protein
VGCRIPQNKKKSVSILVTDLCISGRTGLFTMHSGVCHVSKCSICKSEGVKYNNAALPNNGLVSATVGKTFSLAERDTKRANGTSQRHKVKYAITCK